jgi:glutamine amidotransferase
LNYDNISESKYLCPVKIVIIDYQMGNIHSVARKLNILGVEHVITNNPEIITQADKLILPGVGHFAKAMQQLSESNLISVLNDVVLNQKKPILGICLGMQLLAKFSEEGNVNGLGWIDGQVARFQVKDKLRFKIPHTGWNQIQICKENSMNIGLTNESEFYFVHAYYFQANEESDVLHKSTYEQNFVSAVQKDNIVGVQYHPEKSHDVGLQLIKNFVFEF